MVFADYLQTLPLFNIKCCATKLVKWVCDMYMLLFCLFVVCFINCWWLKVA